MQPPPDNIVARARRRARERGRAVYLFHDGEDWKLTQRLGAIPGGAASFEIAPHPEHPEQGNTGGC
ncbi:MAG: hypothetical protein WD489_07990 [Rhodovibrionaceae bacterium]